MNSFFHHLYKYRLIVAGLLVLLIGFAIIMLIIHNTSNSKADSEAEQAKTETLLEPTSIVQKQITAPPDKKESDSDPTTPTLTTDSILAQSLEKEAPKYDYDLYSLDCIDDKKLWVVKWNYNDPAVHNTTSLLHSVDGGVHWEEYANSDYLLRQVSFADDHTGWAWALKGHPDMTDGEKVTYQLLFTEDGGKSWKVQLTHDAVYASYGKSYEIDVIDKSNAYIIMDGSLYRTVDSGNNWIKTESPIKDFSVEHIEFTDDQNGWISGVVQDELNAGQTSDTASDYPTYHYAVYVFHTMDGAKSFTKQFSKDGGNDWNLTVDIDFSDKENGWFLITNFGSFTDEIYHTVNGGKDWEKPIEGGCRPYVQELEAVTPDILWIAEHGEAGPIEGGLSYTKDGGKSLYFIGEEDGFVNSNGVEFVNSKLGWAVMNGFTDKYLMKTEDGGVTWEKVMF